MSRLTTFNTRKPRRPQAPPLAGYPASIRRLIFWYDGLSDWQRLQYAAIAILFLLACGGYLLGLGSAIVLQRVEAEEAALADQPLPTQEPAATELLIEATATTRPTSTPAPSATAAPPTAAPSQTPFSAPVLAEPPAVPRQLPAAPLVVAPVAPRATATPDKPRNLENLKPEPPAASVATPTAGLVRTVRPTPATAVRQPTPAPTVHATAVVTRLPTLAVPATAAPTPQPRVGATVTPLKTAPAR